MFVVGNFFIALAQVVSWTIGLMKLLLIVRALISWVNPDPFNPIVQFLYGVTEPLLAPARRIIPPIGMFDVSIIVVFIVLMFVESFLVGTLYDLGVHLKGW